MNPLLAKLGKNLHGQKAEKRAARRAGGRLTPGSGNQDHSKGDYRLPNFLVESKSTIRNSLSISIDWLRKISKEAPGTSREPALIVQFVDGSGRVVKDGAWVLIPERIFHEISKSS